MYRKRKYLYMSGANCIVHRQEPSSPDPRRRGHHLDHGTRFSGTHRAVLDARLHLPIAGASSSGDTFSLARNPLLGAVQADQFTSEGDLATPEPLLGTKREGRSTSGGNLTSTPPSLVSRRKIQRSADVISRPRRSVQSTPTPMSRPRKCLRSPYGSSYRAQETISSTPISVTSPPKPIGVPIQ
jgi:hypothetical protein